MTLDINKSRNLWWTISSAVILSGIISMVISWQNPNIKAPLRPGLDFIGGTRLQLVRDCSQPGNCDQPIDINVVREVAKEQGLGDSSIQLISVDREADGNNRKRLPCKKRIGSSRSNNRSQQHNCNFFCWRWKSIN